MPALVVRLPDSATRTVPIGARPLVIGRSETCDLVLSSDEVSREHARVWLDEAGQIHVADTHSKNGTRVDGGEPFRNSVRVARQSIRIGEFEIQIVGVGAARGVEPGVRFQPDPPTSEGQTAFFPSTRRLDLNHQRLGLLMSLTERIGGAFERKQLLEQALAACCEALAFERGLIALKTPRGETDLPVTHNVSKDETGAYTVSRTLINRALVHGERAVVNNPALDLIGNISESLVRFPICSALCVPILHRDEILGVIYGDRVTRASTYTAEDVDFLAAIARQVGVGLANLRMLARHLEMQQVVAELRQAREIQRNLLPEKPLRAGRIALSGYNEPSSAVGGDYFDYFPVGREHLGLIIADVSGHGLPAALMMANLQAAIRVGLTVDIPLPDLATRINQLVYANTASNVFITGIVGRVAPASGIVEYVNAGHPAPLLLRGARVTPQEDGVSLPFGVDPEEPYQVQRIEPRADLDAALFYTDGVIEAPAEDGHLFGLEPLIEALGGLEDRSPEALVRATLGFVNKHLGTGKNADDLTLMALQFLPREG